MPFLLIDKPENWTSHDVVAKLRSITGIKKIGHAGTLDPFATGLLIIGIDRESTRELDKFKNMPKTYEAEFVLGAISDTQDKTGTITPTLDPQYPSKDQLKSILNKFTGKITQIPPMYSAKKIKGKKMYELARQGKEVKRDPIEVEITSIDLLSYTQSDNPTATIRVSCTTGTYIRTLVHDIGQKLGCGAFTKGLRRLSIGNYEVKKSCTLDKLDQDNWQSVKCIINKIYE